MVTIGVLGSHSAEEVGSSAKAFGFKTVVICQKGREQLYTKYNKHLFDHVLLLDKFSDILHSENLDRMKDLDTIFIPNRSFSTYVGYDGIEKQFDIPIYGNKYILRAEERNEPKNQYTLLEKAGIRIPKQFRTPKDIDTLVIVKVQQLHNKLERAFFYASSPEDYHKQGETLVKQDIIGAQDLKEAVIEECVLGPRFNANFQAYGMQDVFGRLDFCGFEDRIQTNLGGMKNLIARDQLKINVPVTNEEVGHFGITMRESKKPLVYDAAERFIDVVPGMFPPKMIGLFSLQGALTDKSEFIVFDLSPRIPGCPCVGPTSPEMRRLTLKHNQTVNSPLDLCMIEIKKAVDLKRIPDITT
ncbi:MAG: DUF1297 domain-containing protein [Candidatus Ranarchaeia archaeon]|jgi:5-formaminoimidazole-4-carboxamide-1-(beta)-D-ribofuranosyl 5'-monophosphate synthetase